MKKIKTQLISILILLVLIYNITPQNTVNADGSSYGAFLSISNKDIKKLYDYDTVSIDVQYFTKKNITKLHKKGIQVFAYLNVGSIENFRDYYDEYADLTFMDYENWDEERWIDVSSEKWQNFVIDNLAAAFSKKDADGVYMDNIDVYSIAKEYYGDDNDKISDYYEGLKTIIQGVSDLGLKVMINGGSEFLTEAITKNDDVVNSLYAYHQEEVFSLIKDYDKNIFKKQRKSSSKYYKAMIKEAAAAGLKIFLLEYTTDKKLIKQIKKYCNNRDYSYYCATKVELD